MPRAFGVMSWPSNTQAVIGTTIESAKYNSFRADLLADLNAARPVSAGGTGATTVAAARTALGIDNDIAALATIALLRSEDGLVADEVKYVKEDLIGGLFKRDITDLSATLVVKSVTSTTVNSTTETITKVAHGFVSGDVVTPTTNVNGVVVNDLYFVSVVDSDNLKLSTSLANALAGTAFNLTATTNFTVEHLLDHKQGVYVIKNGDAVNGSNGAWARQLDGGDIHPRFFEAAADATVTDDSEALCAGAAFLRYNKNSALNSFVNRYDGEGLIYLHQSSLDFGDLNGRAGAVVDFIFNSHCTGDIAVDFIKSQNVFADRLVCIGDTTSRPSCGFCFGREDDGGGIPFPTADSNRMGNIETFGNWDIAGTVNLASEIMHFDSLKDSNGYFPDTAVATVLAGDDAVMTGMAGTPVSKYRTLGLGAQSMSHCTIGNYQGRRSAAYGYTIVGISKANPAVVTISSANATDGNTNFGLVNGVSIFLDDIVGSDPAWADLLSYTRKTIANLNVGAGTFELNGVDTTSTTGTFTSGTLRNATGPSLLFGHCKNISIDGGYMSGFGDHRIRIDARNDHTESIKIITQMETASEYGVKFIGNTVLNKVYNVNLEITNSAVRKAMFISGGVSGAGGIYLINPRVHIGREAQVPTTGMFQDPANFKIADGLMRAPSASWWNDTTTFQAVSRIDWGTVTPAEKPWTPVVTIGASTTGITYGTQVGWYEEEGEMIHAHFQITLTSKGGLTGAVLITGLPFPAAAGTGKGSSVAFGQYATLAAMTSLIGNITAGTSDIIPRNTTSVNAVQLDGAANITNTTTLHGLASYRRDQV